MNVCNYVYKHQFTGQCCEFLPLRDLFLYFSPNAINALQFFTQSANCSLTSKCDHNFCLLRKSLFVYGFGWFFQRCKEEVCPYLWVVGMECKMFVWDSDLKGRSRSTITQFASYLHGGDPNFMAQTNKKHKNAGLLLVLFDDKILLLNLVATESLRVYGIFTPFYKLIDYN